HWVVAKALVAARRPDEDPVDPAIERLDLAIVGPGDRQRAGEMRRWSSVRFDGLALAPDLLHRPRPVAVAVRILGPPRGEYPRAAVERVDAQAAVVGEGRQAGQI